MDFVKALLTPAFTIDRSRLSKYSPFVTYSNLHYASAARGLHTDNAWARVFSFTTTFGTFTK